MHERGHDWPTDDVEAELAHGGATEFIRDRDEHSVRCVQNKKPLHRVRDEGYQEHIGTYGHARSWSGRVVAGVGAGGKNPENLPLRTARTKVNALIWFRLEARECRRVRLPARGVLTCRM